MVMVTLEGNLYSSGTGELGQLGRVPRLFAITGGRQGLGKSHKPLKPHVSAYVAMKLFKIYCVNEFLICDFSHKTC